MTTLEYLGIAGFNLTVIGTTATFFYRIYNEIKSIREDGEIKRGRIYERVDEVKKCLKQEFTSKDVCEILHKQLGQDVSEIKADIKLLLRKNAS